MSKALDIRKAFASRLASVATVIRGKRQFNEDELPAIAVYMQPREVESTSSTRRLMTGDVVIEYHKEAAYNTEPDDQADAMLAEIRAAVEIDPATLTERPSLVVPPGIQYAGDDIAYPESAGGIIAVIATYTAPHIETFG